MTRVHYDREGLCLAIEGHAGAGEYGRDTVCAALSILVMSLEKRLGEMDGDVLVTVSRSPGRVRICAAAGAESERLCRESFDTVFAGLRLLGENRPENVQLTERGGDETWN